MYVYVMIIILLIFVPHKFIIEHIENIKQLTWNLGLITHSLSLNSFLICLKCSGIYSLFKTQCLNGFLLKQFRAAFGLVFVMFRSLWNIISALNFHFTQTSKGLFMTWGFFLVMRGPASPCIIQSLLDVTACSSRIQFYADL